MLVFDTLFRMSSNRIRLRKNALSLSCLKGKSNSLDTAYAQLLIFNLFVRMSVCGFDLF